MSARLKRKPSLGRSEPTPLSSSIRRTSKSQRVSPKSPNARRSTSPASTKLTKNTPKITESTATPTGKENKSTDGVNVSGGTGTKMLKELSNCEADKSVLDGKVNTKAEEEGQDLVTTPKIPRKELTTAVYRVRRSELLKEIGKLFQHIPIQDELEEIQEESFSEEKTFCGQLLPVEEESVDIVEQTSEEEKTDATLVRYMCDSWKKLMSIHGEREKVYHAKCSIGSRIIQLCDSVHRKLNILSPSSFNVESMVELFLSLSNLRELSQCWLVASPMETASAYEEASVKLFNSCESAVSQLDDLNQGLKSKRNAEKALEKLIFLIGKRLLEINSSIEEQLWSILDEVVMDNLAKGSSTQFSITLHTLMDQISKSLMTVSSLAHHAYVNRKSDSIQSLLETSVELLDEMQKVMRKFKIWHEYHNGENTLTQLYELQFLWHSENYQYLNLLYSLINDYTKNINKIIEEPGSIIELPMLEKILESIKTNLNGIQSSLPFSSESEMDTETVSESVALLNDLEQTIRQSIMIIGKQCNLINTSFIWCKGILKKAPTYYSSALELSTLSSSDTGQDDGNNRRVHFSDSIEAKTVEK